MTEEKQKYEKIFQFVSLAALTVMAVTYILRGIFYYLRLC